MGKELFDNIPSKVGDLLSDVRNGKVGLPDLQRPFVWKDSKARDLLDSMLKGYPIGYIMLWQSPDGYETVNHIGTNDKTYIQPDYLVIDGQQRLTAWRPYPESRSRIKTTPSGKSGYPSIRSLASLQSGQRHMSGIRSGLAESVLFLRRMQITMFRSSAGSSSRIAMLAGRETEKLS